ncbi:ATP-binding cassette domain-containing protein [Lactobacillus sp. YT155]|uniref:ATP-binding cassette domain-containing protein n=1 Tax=Lactobacillus sp. YT155 TaxID=3060955 RepID=UPI00265DD698|nr:ATP-binding cassette domain-containing protein [Lactobacillus sp. YT155]MDO1604972.1 ATP-binding cassette domain-containing protein [Lactobacillus sp. YT155]
MIEFKDLSKEFSDKKLFENANFTINDGDFVGVVGKNGSGKTTLIKILMGLEKPSSGTIKLSKSKFKFGYVPQFRNIDSDYPLSIASFIELNLKKSGMIFKNQTDKDKLAQALEQTGLTEIKDLPLGLASGGEKQKAYLAQAIVNNPDVLILDESTASLDGSAKEKLMEVVQKLNQEQKLTVIFISHDYLLVKEYVQKCLFFENHHIDMKDVSELSEKVFED